MKRILYIVALALLGTTLAMGQGSPLPLLEGNTSARTLALGKVRGAGAKDMYLYTNPTAFLANGATFQVDGNIEIFPKLEFGRELQYTLSGAWSFAPSHALFVGGRYSGGLKIEVEGMPGEKVESSFRPYSLSADLGYAYAVEHWGFFAKGSYHRTALQIEAETYLFGAGVSYLNQYTLFGKGVEYGLHAIIDGVGAPLRYRASNDSYTIQPTLELSTDQTLSLAEKHQLTLTLGARGTLKEDPANYRAAGVGLEYSYNQLLDLRLGYDYHTLRDHSLGFGIGGKLYGVHLDLGYQLGFRTYSVNTLMVTAGYAF